MFDLFALARSTYFGWFDDGGNLLPPKDREHKHSKRILDSEVQAVVAYRKFTWQMVDENIAFLSESSVYEILKSRNMLGWSSGFGPPAEKEYKNKPQHPHHHWHTDLAYIKINGHFYFLIMMLDGYSRFLLDWDLLTDMNGKSVEDFVLRVREKYPDRKPMLIANKL